MRLRYTVDTAAGHTATELHLSSGTLLSLAWIFLVWSAWCSFRDEGPAYRAVILALGGNRLCPPPPRPSWWAALASGLWDHFLGHSG